MRARADLAHAPGVCDISNVHCSALVIDCISSAVPRVRKRVSFMCAAARARATPCVRQGPRQLRCARLRPGPAAQRRLCCLGTPLTAAALLGGGATADGQRGGVWVVTCGAAGGSAPGTMNMRAWRQCDARKDQGAAAHKRLAGPRQAADVGHTGGRRGMEGRVPAGHATPLRSVARTQGRHAQAALHQQEPLIVWGCNACGRQERCKRCKARMTAPRPATAAALPRTQRRTPPLGGALGACLAGAAAASSRHTPPFASSLLA